MNTTISFRRDEGLALAAAMVALQKIGVETPILAAITHAFTEAARCHLVTVFADGSTVEVLRARWCESWVRIFAPDWTSTMEFQQGDLTIQASFNPQPAIKLGILHRVPMAKLHWAELPEHLRRDAPAALRSQMMF